MNLLVPIRGNRLPSRKPFLQLQGSATIAWTSELASSMCFQRGIDCENLDFCTRVGGPQPCQRSNRLAGEKCGFTLLMKSA